MPLNIKNERVEQLIDELSAMTGETKTETVRKALEERKNRLAFHIKSTDKDGKLRRILETEIWPAIPGKQFGKRLSRKEEEAILGYGPKGI